MVRGVSSDKYCYSEHPSPSVLIPNSTGIFLRWSRSSKYLDEAYEEMVNIIEYNKELQAKVNILRRQLAELETDDGLRESP